MKRDLVDKLTSIVKVQWMRWKHRRVGNFDVFISYSHDPSRTLAFALHDSLEKLSRNWYSFRALNVFLDRSSLGPTMMLEKELESIIKRSEWLVYICSENAAKSAPVIKELNWYIEHNGVDKLILIVDDGVIRWDREAERFSRTTTNIPNEVLSKIKDEPLWIDLRGRNDTQESLESYPDYLDAVLSISSRVQNTSRKALLDRENKRQNRLVRFRWTFFVVLSAFLVISVAVSWVAVSARNEALSNLNVATARAFAARANELSESDSADSRIYAAQAWDLHKDEVTRTALLKSVVNSQNLTRHRVTSGAITSITANTDETVVYIGHEDGTVERWELSTNELKSIGKLRFPVKDITTDRSGKVVAATGWKDIYNGNFEAEVKLWRPGKELCRTMMNRYGGAAVSPSGETIVLPPQDSDTVRVLRGGQDDCDWKRISIGDSDSKIPPKYPNDVIALPDDNLVVIQSNTRVDTYSLRDGRPVFRIYHQIMGPDDESPVLSDNGAYSFGDGGVISTQQIIGENENPIYFNGKLEWVKHAYTRWPLPAVSPDGLTAAVINADGLAVYDVENDRPNKWKTAILPVGKELSALAVPTKHVVLTAIGSSVSYWKMNNPSKIIRGYDSTAAPMCDVCGVSRISPSHSGKYLAQHWNGPSGDFTYILNSDDGTESVVEDGDFLAWRTDEDFFAIQNGKTCLYRAVDGGSERCWSIPSWIEDDSSAGNITSNPGRIKGVWDGNSLKFSNGSTIWSFNYKTHQFSQTIPKGRVVEMTSHGIVVSEDSEEGPGSGIFKVIYSDGKVETYDHYVWLANDGSSISTSRNGTVVANSSYGAIEQRSYPGGSSTVDISTNGEYLAYVDSLSSVSVYSLAARTKVGTIPLPGVPYSAAAVQFTPSGSSLYLNYFDSSTGREVTLKVDLNPDSWYDDNCKVVRRSISSDDWSRVTEMDQPKSGFACSSYSH